MGPGVLGAETEQDGAGHSLDLLQCPTVIQPG